jgi:PhzF family phenazine biosynthesis protein
MKLKLYQVDAFTSRVFGGNPAAVCPLDQWIPDELMQQIAEENNLAETAFYVKNGDAYDIRWFTPKAEVVLAGHPTLATAFVLKNYEGHAADTIAFNSKSGLLVVEVKDGFYTLDFPADSFKEQLVTEHITKGFNVKPQKIYRGKTDLMFVYESEREVAELHPNFNEVARLDVRGIICTAPGTKGSGVDFVSRFFAPQLGINEDPVTGSAHTTLIPYWSNVLNKKELNARQISWRLGELSCVLKGERVAISGRAVSFMQGIIEI